MDTPGFLNFLATFGIFLFLHCFVFALSEDVSVQHCRKMLFHDMSNSWSESVLLTWYSTIWVEEFVYHDLKHPIFTHSLTLSLAFHVFTCVFRRFYHLLGLPVWDHRSRLSLDVISPFVVEKFVSRCVRKCVFIVFHMFFHPPFNISSLPSSVNGWSLSSGWEGVRIYFNEGRLRGQTFPSRDRNMISSSEVVNVSKEMFWHDILPFGSKSWLNRVRNTLFSTSWWLHSSESSIACSDLDGWTCSSTCLFETVVRGRRSRRFSHVVEELVFSEYSHVKSDLSRWKDG